MSSRHWTEKDIDEAEGSADLNLSDDQRKEYYAKLDEQRRHLADEEGEDARFIVSEVMIAAGKEALREATPGGRLPFDRDDVVIRVFKAMLRQQ